MRKLKSILACLIVVATCFVFASCSKKVETLSFEEGYVVMEVGQTFDPSLKLDSQVILKDVAFKSSDQNVVRITSDNKLEAVAVGSAQIEATLNKSKAHMVVEVVLKKEKLSTPVAIQYNSVENKITWNAVNNANSYDVMVNDQVVALKTINTFFQPEFSQQITTIAIKANGIGAYADSDYSAEFSYKQLTAPTNVKFDKNTQKLSWEHSDSSAKFRVCVNNTLKDVGSSKSYNLNLAEAGQYQLSVITVADENQKDGDAMVFDSPKSEVINVSRLDQVDGASIVWNSTTKLLTWSQVDGASYSININTNTYSSNTNNLEITDLAKGKYIVSILAVSDDDNVLNAKTAAQKEVEITQQHAKVEILSYNELTNQLVVSTSTGATSYQIYNGSTLIYDGQAIVESGKATITLDSDVFNTPATYSLTAVAKADEKNFFTESFASEVYEIVRLAKPTHLNVQNARNLTFANSEIALGYVLFVGSEKYDLSEATYDLFNLSAGIHEIRVGYKGNANTVLSSEFSTIIVEKLATPELMFDKSTQTLILQNNSQFNHNVKIGELLLTNIKTAISLEAYLSEGNNVVEVQAINNAQNQVLSNKTTLNIGLLQQVEELTHYVEGGYSYLQINENLNYNDFEVLINLEEKDFSLVQKVEGKTTLRLETKTNELFPEAGEYQVKLRAHADSANVVGSKPVTLKISKYDEPTNLSYTNPAHLSWSDSLQEDEQSSYRVEILNASNVVVREYLIENALECDLTGLGLGTFTAKVNRLGNQTSTIDSNKSQITFDHTKTLLKPELVFDKQKTELKINLSDTDTSNVVIFVNGQEKQTFAYSPTITYGLKELTTQAKAYQIYVEAKNTTNPDFINGSTSDIMTLIKLSQVNVTYQAEGQQLKWEKVFDADGYSLVIGENSYNTEDLYFSTSSLTPAHYMASLVATSTLDYIISSEPATVTFDVTRKLTTPTNVQYSKADNKITYDRVEHADGYKIFVNDVEIQTVTTLQFGFNKNQFDTAGIYKIEVQAVSNSVYAQPSDLSNPCTIERLAAPENISVTDIEENIIVAYDGAKVERVEILVNGVGASSLLSFDGQIRAEITLIGLGDNFLDSATARCDFTRLQTVTNLRVEHDQIVWANSTYVSGYKYAQLYDGDSTPEEMILESAATSKDFTGSNVGSYTVTLTAIGGPKEIDGVIHNFLTSRPASITVERLTEPTNVALVEDVENSTITVSFEGVTGEVDGYEVFVQYNGGEIESYGTTTTNSYSFASSRMREVGNYEVFVRTLGLNEKNTISSLLSEPFETQRLAATRIIYVGYDYYVMWQEVHALTTYRVQAYFEQKDGDVTIQEIVIPADPNSFVWVEDEYGQYNLVVTQEISFFESAMSDQFKDMEGTINVSICAIGNNTSLLCGETITLAVAKSTKPVVTNDADKIYFDKTNEHCYFELTVYKDGNRQDPILPTVITNLDHFEIPESWESGEYTFEVRRINHGQLMQDDINWSSGMEFISGYTIFTKTKLSPIDTNSLSFVRDETNEDIVYMSWEPTDQTNEYLVTYLDPQSGLEVELYKGSQNSVALPDSLPDGSIYIFFRSLGDPEIGFTSIPARYNPTKLSSLKLEPRIENGVLTWNAVGTSIASGYKIVVNRENVSNTTTFVNDKAILYNSLQGQSGQLNIKIKALGNFTEQFGFDSNYAEFSAYKLPAPTELKVVDGAIEWAHSYILGEGESVEFVYVVDGKEFVANEQGLQEMTSTLIANKNYELKMYARNVATFLSSDLSDPITINILENPSVANGSTYLSTNVDKTQTAFNWLGATGAGKYEVKIAGGDLNDPKIETTIDTLYQITGLKAGGYNIAVRRIGSTGELEGINYISSQFSTPIEFVVLEAPIVRVENGVLVWDPQTGADNYYLHTQNAYKPCENVNSWTFAGEYIDYTTKTDIKVNLQAVGDGISYLASAKTEDISLVKPRPPMMLTMLDGGLTWDKEADYTYYSETENKQIYLDFMQNSVTYESFEISAELLAAGWPLGNEYLQKITTNLPAGTYTLRIRQIGDNKNVITSEFAPEQISVTVAPAPTEVKIEDHILSWNKVDLENYNQTNIVSYVVYVFDTEVGDWVELVTTENTSISLDNDEGDILMKPSYTEIAISTRGNTSGEGLTNYMTGNRSNGIAISVLGHTDDLQTLEGELVWGTVTNATKYRIESLDAMGGTINEVIVDGNIQSSILSGFASNVEHNIRIRAIGNGTSENGDCTINGVWGQTSKFTKLELPVVSTLTEAEDKVHWGAFQWNCVANSSGYNVYIDLSADKSEMVYIEQNYYESTVMDNAAHDYQFQAKGNSAIPSEQNIAYISSDISSTLRRARMDKIWGVEVIDGTLYWTQSNSVFSPKTFFVEFYQEGSRIVRVPVEVRAGQTVTINNIDKVKFDVAGYVTNGTYDVYIREVCNSETYITGIESDVITISKLEAPQNVHLDSGILCWEGVVDATGYIIQVKNRSGIVQNITEGFVFDEGTNLWKWSSTLGVETYTVCVRAISIDQNKLSSSWANIHGEMTPDSPVWEVLQIPTIELRNINVDDEGNVVWNYLVGTNLPANRAYIIWRKGEQTPSQTPVLENSYAVDADLQGISIRTIPYGENTLYYFASAFSEIKDIDRPLPPTNLAFDEVSQTFTWDSAGTSDASYVVCYTINGGEEQTYETMANKFEPSVLGTYKVAVKVKKSDSSIGTSEKSEAIEGEFNLFSGGAGTKADPFKIYAGNFDNMIYRPSAHFTLMTDITRSNVLPLGEDEKGNITQFTGKLYANNKTITLSFSTQTKSMLVGLFAELGNGAHIKDLTVNVNGNVDLSSTSLGQIHAGIIAGSLNGQEAKIENCKVIGTTTLLRAVDSETRFGSIVGVLKSGVITDCVSELNITSDTTYITKIGGIAGVVGSLDTSSTTSTIQNSTNKGIITGANVIGGIAAYNYGTINNCHNEGALTSFAFYGENMIAIRNDSIVGGIVGESRGVTSSSEVVAGIITNCSNSGVITANNQTGDKQVSSIAGGIVGTLEGGKVDQNKSFAEVLIGQNSSSTTKQAQAIVGLFKNYSETSTNYKASNLTQAIPTGIKMTIENM